MRLFSALSSTMLVAFLLLVQSCTTNSTSSTNTPRLPQSETATTDDRTQTVSVAVPNWLISQSKSYYSDGVLSGYTSYSYGNDGRLSLEEQFSGTEVLILQRAFSWQLDNSLKIETLDAEKKLQATTIQQFSQGRLQRESILNTLGVAQIFSEYSYDSAGRKSSWVIQGSGIRPITTRYVFADGKNTQVQVLDSGQAVLKRYEKKFDESGSLVSEDKFDSRGQLLKRTLFSYETKNLIHEQTLNADGKIIRSVKYQYGKNNEQLIRIEEFDGDGRLQEVRTHTWLANPRAAGRAR